MTQPSPTEKQQQFINELENLIRIATRHGVVVAGFAFNFKSTPALFINFGNCADAGELKLYERLVEIRNQQIENGTAPENIKVEEVN